VVLVVVLVPPVPPAPTVAAGPVPVSPDSDPEQAPHVVTAAAPTKPKEIQGADFIFMKASSVKFALRVSA
jgi:hypothetical protein